MKCTPYFLLGASNPVNDGLDRQKDKTQGNWVRDNCSS